MIQMYQDKMLKTQVFMFLILLIVCYSTSDQEENNYGGNCDCVENEVKRSNFPKGFMFGVGSAAYQFEGGYKDDGKGPSNWDYYMHKHPERITDHTTGDVANDFYHRYKEDVAIIKNMGLDTFRFSISWSRILPYGTLNGSKVNQKGIDFYNNLINELLANGIEPFATIFHWDIPLALDNAFGGFLSSRIVNEFDAYAEICFREFGDRVKHWITFNEPHTFSVSGYATGADAPGRCSSWQNLGCTGGDSGTEPYIVAHHQLLAHAAAVKTYREKYQDSQKGKIGITLNSFWFLPYSNSKDDRDAQQRSVDFMLGWFLHPVTYGEYPRIMRELVGSRLPKFTKEESERVKGSFDFLGLNYYSTVYSKSVPPSEPPSYTTDTNIFVTGIRNDIPIGTPGGSDWLFIYPIGLREFMRYVKKNYNDPLIYITENGVSEKNDEKLSVADACNDVVRKNYHHDHLCCLKKAISEDDVNVAGYIAWSFMDNLEWAMGYSERFGLYYVDYKNNLTRHEKYSAKWLKSVLVKDEQESLPKIADH